VSDLSILQATAHFQPKEYGGFEHYLCKGLSELGHKVHLITSDKIAPRFSKDKTSIGIGQQIVEKYKIYRFRTILEVKSVPFVDSGVINFLSDLDFDVVHAHEVYQPISLQSLHVARKRKKPYGFTQHRNYCPQSLQGSFFRLFYQSIGKKLINSCDFICAASNSAANFLRNFGIKRQIEILPNCLDAKMFRPNIKTDLDEKMGLKNHRVILSVGRLHKEKGFEYLIRAFKMINDKHHDAKLVLVGRGDEREKLESETAKFNIRNDVILINHLPHQKMPDLYNICDIFILPSIIEPFGMTLVEAMACGKPVVGSKVGGISDIIDNEINGFLTEPRNSNQLARKIEILLSDEKLRIKFGREGRKKVENMFSYEEIAKKATDIYQRVLESK